MDLQSVNFSPRELARYSRHLTLPEIGAAGQRALKRSSVLLIGAGGLGSPLGLYLAAAGVGKLGIVDDDVVDETNLQRQVIHGTAAVGQSKAESAAKRIADINPYVETDVHRLRLDASNVAKLVEAYDIVVDGSDNFPTRFLVNDACVFAGKADVFGCVYRFEGQASVLDARLGPCYRCLYPEAPPPGSVPSCAEGGVLGILPGIIGLIQATETIKLVTGIGETLVGRLLMFDALQMRFSSLALEKDPACPVCGLHPAITTLREETYACDPGAASVDPSSISVAELDARQRSGQALEILDVREPAERDIARLANTFEIPLADLDQRVHELPKEREIVVYCLSGGRSQRAVQLLRDAGFRNVRNLTGGIRAWTDEIDPTLTRY